MDFLGKDKVILRTGERLSLRPYIVSSAGCHDDCQLSGRWWE